MDNTIFENLKKMLVENLKVDESLIVANAELTNDLGINSLELADLVLLCEEQYDIEINSKAANKLKTVGDVVKYLETIV